MAPPDYYPPRKAPMFQSPSRGGRLCGCNAVGKLWVDSTCFSPLHEGDASVAARARLTALRMIVVSVPFTRGTPLWRWTSRCQTCGYWVSVPFTRGTPLWPSRRMGRRTRLPSFSPLHEGDASVALAIEISTLPSSNVSVPFTRGTPLWREASAGMGDQQRQRFSPLHEGDASVALDDIRRLGDGAYVSVPFTRGTPLWR